MSDGAPDGAGLAELAGFGEYFALPVFSGTVPDTEWRCLAGLFTEDVLTDHVRRTQAAMATAAGCAPEELPLRVAASSFQLGVAARLLSPVIGAALCFGAIPVLDRRSVYWQPSRTHTPRFAVAAPQWASGSADAIGATVVPALAELGGRLDGLFSLSTRVTLGNLASAANGAVTVLGMTRPELLAPGRALVRALVAGGPLAGTGGFTADRFSRRSCCLYYQAPRSGLCGDCVLVTSHPTDAG